MHVKTIKDTLAELHVLEDLTPAYLDFLIGCARNVHFDAGQFLQVGGRPAEHFFVIRSGQVALELEAANKVVTIQTVQMGGVVGWSWLVPPYRWHYDARAVTPISAIQFDATCVRQKCDADPVFGYEVFKRFSNLIVKRLMGAQIQLADVYQ